MRVDPNELIKKGEPVTYPRDIVLRKLYENSYTIKDYEDKIEKIRRDKYISLALERGYDNYRITNVGELGKKSLLNSFYYNVRDFMNREGEFLIIFNTLSGVPLSAIIRKIGGKDFLDYGVYPCPYGLDKLNSNFRYGDYILITEGVYDADSFRNVYNNTVAMLTSSVSTMQAEILCTITDKFVIAFDNDPAGEKGKEMSLRNIKKVNRHATIDILKVYSEDKDLGEMEEKKDDEYEYSARKAYYEGNLDILTGGRRELLY